MKADHLGAGGDGDRGRRGRCPLALARLGAPLPRAREHRAEEVLPGQRHEQRPAPRPELAEPAQDLEVLVHREVEVEAGVEGYLLLFNP